MTKFFIRLNTAALTLAPLAAWAEEAEGEGGEPFFTLYNTEFVVMIAFLAFIGVLVWLKVPGKLGEMLDRRAGQIRNELDEARKLREEAQAVLASYERKQKEAAEQVERIIHTARDEAQAAADKAKADLKVSIARRLASAEDQIASAQAAAVRDVRDRAVQIATQVAGEILSKGMTAQRGNALIDDAIETVEKKLH
jgi:F-type H+-transporting ATPase subunit b